MTFHEWKKKTFTWVDNDVARYMQRAWAASTKEQAKQKAKLKAENAKLQESNNQMAELLKEKLAELNVVVEFNKKGSCEEVLKLQISEAARITNFLTAAEHKL